MCLVLEYLICPFALSPISPLNEHLDNSPDWVFDMFDDMDIITYLYSNEYLAEDHPFHFKHWSDQQFYMEETNV